MSGTTETALFDRTLECMTQTRGPMIVKRVPLLVSTYYLSSLLWATILLATLSQGNAYIAPSARRLTISSIRRWSVDDNAIFPRVRSLEATVSLNADRSESVMGQFFQEAAEVLAGGSEGGQESIQKANLKGKAMLDSMSLPHRKDEAWR